MRFRGLMLTLILLIVPCLTFSRITKKEGVNIPTRVVVVKEGDTLSKLAEQYLGDQERWREILNVNNISNPEVILPGEKIHIPISEMSTEVTNHSPAILVLQPTEDDTPEFDSNPVMTEHIFVVKVMDSNGKPVSGARVEWVLNDFPGSTGDIIEADDDGKKTNRYAVTYTNDTELVLHRSVRDGPDITVHPGETWVGITASYPGETRIVAICPSIPMGSQRIVYATGGWRDIAWEFPVDATHVINFSDNSKNIAELGTKVFKSTTLEAVPGMTVNYVIDELEGMVRPVFSNGQNSISVKTDTQGMAVGIISLSEPAIGTANIRCSLLDDQANLLASDRVQVSWEGPVLTLTATGPAKMSMMQTSTFTVEIANTGTVPASDIKIEFTSDNLKVATPIPDIPTVEPNKTEKIRIQATAVKPGNATCSVSATSAEGIQSIDNVTLTIDKPKLRVSLSGPEAALLGSQVTYSVTVSNDGQEPIDNAQLSLSIPADSMRVVNSVDGVYDDQSKSIEWTLPQIGPGQSYESMVVMSPAKEGIWELPIEMRYGAMVISDKTITRVTAPDLKLALDKTLLAAKVNQEYQVTATVSNVGSSIAEDITLDFDMPAGLLLASAVPAPIDKLRPGESQNVTFTLTATDAGQHSAVITANCVQGVTATASLRVVAVARAELELTIADSSDPVIAGSDLSYTVEVKNVGTTAAKSVRLTIALPSSLSFVEAITDNGSPVHTNGMVTLDIGDIEPSALASVVVKVNASIQGDVVVKCQVSYSGSTEPGVISAQEITSIISLEDQGD